ncbi:S46 family peptidase [Sphingosinicella sp. LY1275]|uniref:S46 family peptidase n=1 Tax=Sphingosinicella sp. LY1275 TaxID=3095379 RepID=UPI002ADEB36C|nr:S46 family peptidase [Sphingosinicella sp. LY1275]MEA1013784.1 S46 family peptidase [Sphingosinicella sp. LY1275]
MIRHAAGFVTLAFLLAAQAGAEEGMWLPSQTPSLAPTLKQAGLTLDPAVLANLQKAPLNAIVSLGGCSASFVSPQGLVATNHHCVQGSIQYNSKPGQDYLTNGFLAGALKDEVPAAPGTRVFVIEDLRDVSAAMNKGVTPAMSGLQRYDRMEANRKRLISACEKQPNRRCDVRAYYGGATYFLQQQLEIKDVRLVYAPAEGIGNFGGETDNWQWPRHTGDFGFYRAYVAPDGSSAPYSEANVPYQPKSWLKIAQQGVKDGDYVMVAGFPGVTDRLRSAAEADFYYDSYYPAMQKLLADYSAAIGRATAGNEDATIKYASILQGTDNYKKKLLGQMAGADAVRLGEQKKAQEAEYRAWVAADPQRQKRYGASIAALDALIAEANEASLSDLRANLINRAQLLSASRTLYRWSLERAKPDAQREPGYQDRDRQLVTERLRQIERRFVPEVDRALFDAALAEYRKLPAAKRNAAFEAKLAEIGADRLYAETKLGDTATRLAWLDKPAAEFGASADPFLQLAVAMAPAELAKEKADKDRAGRLQRARSDYMKGMLAYAAATGKPMYPDANGSLRFTYGKVTGRTRDGQIWTPFTTAEGMAAKHTGKGEFDAPDKAVALVAAKDYGPYASPELGTLPVDFLSTVDITNGNSGSATLNAQGEFVGLAFDGTLDGVIADWWYEPSINRTIHVDSRYMLWVMDKVDGAQRLLDEMGVR